MYTNLFCRYKMFSKKKLNTNQSVSIGGAQLRFMHNKNEVK